MASLLRRTSGVSRLCESGDRRGTLSKELYSEDEKDAAKKILEYLQNYPEAKDTMIGIQWWLWRSISMNIERAVSFLLSEELLVETKRTGLPPYYCVNPDKSDEIAMLLRKT